MRLLIFIICLIFNVNSFAAKALEINLSDTTIVKDQTFTQKDLTATFKCPNCEIITATIVGENKNFILSQEEKNGSKVILQKTFKIKDVPSFFQLYSNTPNFINESDKKIIQQLEGKFSTSYGQRLRAYLLDKKLYSLIPSSLESNEDNLLKLTFTIPSFAMTGNYEIFVKLYSANGTYINGAQKSFTIKQSGFYNEVVNFANNSPFLYAISSVILAIILGGIGGLINLDLLRRTKAF